MRIEFRTEPHYCDLPDGRTRRLLSDAVVLIDGQPVLIPAGFLTDGASVPRGLWNIIPPFGRYNKAALLHDFLYKTGRMNRARVTRKQADEIFLAAMVALDVPGWQRWAMYAGVRVGAWRAWGCYRDADIYREAWGLER